MNQAVQWSGPATRDMRRLDRTTAGRIRQAINRYADTGYGDVIPLRGREREWRLRVGQWRALFTVDAASDDVGETIVVLRVLPRGNAYRI